MKERLSPSFARPIAFAHDLFMIPTAWLGAFWLRFNFATIPIDAFDAALETLWFILPLQTALFIAFGLYRGIWRFASMPDMVRILKVAAIGVALSATVVFLTSRGLAIPRSVPVVYGLLLVGLLGGPRLLYRWRKDKAVLSGPGNRVLIVGAGRAGEMLVRDMLRNPQEGFAPVAFVDDKARCIGRDVHGLPVLGETADIPKLVSKKSIDLIVIAMPSASAKQMRRVVALCESANVPFRTVPQLRDLLSGNVRVNDLREVSIEDLLGRDPVSLDWDRIRDGLSGKTILVTGGGGSIGSELCRQLAALSPERLVILEQSEYNLYSIEMELRQTFPKLDLRVFLGDVVDRVFVDHVFEQVRPNAVFHAAAYKHVPMLEPQIRQAARNNVVGTMNVADAANASAVQTFVLVSTDKAVNPANVMGTTKRAAEIYCQNLDRQSRTRFITVRFGNVLGSAGSVVPLFRTQIASGGPVTVTDPEIERFFMTIPEACQLIMQTAVMGNGGEIFVLDMGEPVKIRYLAEQMIRLSGKTPGSDIEIQYVGLRPGEKLYEELFHESEALSPTQHPKVLLAHHRQHDVAAIRASFRQIGDLSSQFDEIGLGRLLCELVPENRCYALNGYRKPNVLPIARVS